MLRVRVNWTGLNQGFSVMHFNPPGELQGDAQDAADAAGAFIGAVDNFLRVDQAWTIDPEVLVIDPTTGQTTGVRTVTVTPGTGADAGNAVPNASMILVRWRTGDFFNGRELRGRTFIPGATATSVQANGNLSDTAVQAINAAAATLISNSAFCIYGPTTGIVSEVDTGSTWTEFATLRSRRD